MYKFGVDEKDGVSRVGHRWFALFELTNHKTKLSITLQYCDWSI